MSTTSRSGWVFAAACLFVIGGLTVPRAGAQPRAEVAASASYYRVGVSNGVNLAGWQVNPDVNFTRNVALAFDVAGQYKNAASIYELMAGPRFKYRTDQMTFFAHGMVGGEAVHGYGTQGAFAFGFGGGTDVRLTDQVSIRIFQLDSIHDVSKGFWGHNVRASAGVVFRLGTLE